MRNFVLIIPALNPPESLISYVGELLKHGVKQIIVVNDGSNEKCQYIFDKIETKPRCTVLTHRENRGKGRALKTAFQYVLEHHSDLPGVVTADADGQHAVEDVLKVGEALEEQKEALVLGVRDFHSAGVPFRSILGNRSMSILFRLLFGTHLEDTQTGLRGIVMNHLKKMVYLKGERFEYEINMLVYAKVQGIPFLEVPIQTLYFDKNSGSHYKAIIDSMKVFHRFIVGFFRSLSRKDVSFWEEKVEGK